MSLGEILKNTLYFLALLNPISKVLFLISRKTAYSRKEISSLAIKSSAVSLLILLFLSGIGNFILVEIFHVDIYSLSVAGGIILFSVGFAAVKTGSFHHEQGIDEKRPSDISIVPLAAPLIVGPGIITAAITFSSMYGIISTSICITIALSINMFSMMLSSKIGYILEKLKATEPLTRITGLIVTAVAMQMIFTGCGIWIAKVT